MVENILDKQKMHDQSRSQREVKDEFDVIGDVSFR